MARFFLEVQAGSCNWSRSVLINKPDYYDIPVVKRSFRAGYGLIWDLDYDFRLGHWTFFCLASFRGGLLCLHEIVRKV